MTNKKSTMEKVIRSGALLLALAFCLFSLIFFAIKSEKSKAFMGLISVLYVFIPNIAQKIFKFRIQTTLYIFILVYAICPLLGFSYNLYYHLHWWDDILHGFAGIIFAVLGAHLPKVLSKNGEASVAMCAFSAFFFSVAVAGLWELVEFFMDSNFGTDMQKDTLTFGMRPSYLLSEMLGMDVGELTQIKDAQIIINGQTMDGYVDIGLIDSMKDVFVETLGAAVYLVIYRACNGKHFIFEPTGEPKAAAIEGEPTPQTEIAASEEQTDPPTEE